MYSALGRLIMTIQAKSVHLGPRSITSNLVRPLNSLLNLILPVYHHAIAIHINLIPTQAFTRPTFTLR